MSTSDDPEIPSNQLMSEVLNQVWERDPFKEQERNKWEDQSGVF